ncbi:hypothetical protein [Viridibacterium curvum]|uniref:Lysozyme inhibitor LprI N-terminal domain-containing protein n=1 Tax=Viridibacterium curvum TaxID=1101404 RepID=A0ABP9QSG0_9RHOO
MKSVFSAFRHRLGYGLAKHMVGALLGALLMPAALAASFPCEKARTPIEKTICNDAELSGLDEYLGRYYSAARTAVGRGDACLAADQTAWLRSVRGACKDATCLIRVYLSRLATLHALQPGASVLQRDLPPEMPLVAVIPPALDEVAAPRNTAAQPLVAQGRLVDEVGTGDGHVLKTTAGARHIVMSTMLLESPASETLAALARTPNTSYEVRGFAETSGDGSRNFAPGRCSLVYRLLPAR